MNGSAGSSRQKKQKQELTGSNGAVPASRTESGGPVVGLAVRIAEIIASQEAAHTVLLPAGRRLQLFYRRTLSAAEQVDAGLLLRVFLDCWFGYCCECQRHPSRPSAVSPSLFCFAPSPLIGAGA